MRKIVNINSKWAFSKMATEVPQDIDNRWDFVNLPHSFNAIDGQDGGNDYFRGTAYYAKKLDKTDLPEAEKYFLEIKGANSSADVYMNGKKLFHHDGGYSTFRVDITEHLDRESLLVIAVDNSPSETVYPQVADFTFYGGIYRDVNIICTAKNHFDLMYYGGPGIKVTPTVEGINAKTEVEVYLKDDLKETQKLVYTLYDKEENELKKIESTETKVLFEIEKVHLWQGKKDPYLYCVEAAIVENEQVIDNVCTRFGCRFFEIDAQRGFILNGEEYPLRGVSRHQDRWGIGNALLPEHHKEDMDLICELGATTIRLAHYQHDQYFYDLCDEKGLVVWAEIPYISQHMAGGRENTVSQMKELIVQNYNHPSIVVWGLSNEITMKGDKDPDLLENHTVLNDLCHLLDPTRLTTVAAVSPAPIDSPYLKIPDVVSYNHYFGWYGGDTDMNGPWFDNFHKVNPSIPIGCSEYGCEALNWHTSNPTQGDYTEEYQAYYHEELIKQLFTRKYLWATHVWNMFDFGADARCEGGENGQNHKGLITFDRKYKKDAFYAYKAWLSDEPFVHICSKRYVDRVEDITKVTVYSNLPEVELFANGVSVGKKAAEDRFFYFDVENIGETNLVAVAGEFKDSSIIKKVDVFNEDYRLKEKNAVLNWFDITEVEDHFSLNDKISDIFATLQGKMLFMGLVAKFMPKKGDKVAGGFEMNDSMMSMLGGFTVLRLSGMLGMVGVDLTKEQLLDLNAKLNKIKKPKSTK
ncbi:MAG: glycoside hydrolase family 2 protein [Ruminococcaceae bacterium]|nr:glycoside hydrolase family 2 protein [Oscillospiraceae bacterium]